MRKILKLSLTAALALLVQSTAQAVSLGSGALYYTNGSVVATEQWGPDADLNDFAIFFDVDQVGDLVTYTYKLQVPQKDLSHWILQLCPELTADNVQITGATKVEFGIFGPHPSNPGFPEGGFYGVKFDDGYGTGELIFTLVTDRAPVIGRFYAKDGKNGGNDVYAYNTGLGNTEGAFILVPGCEQIPEPTGFVLTVAGMALFGLIRRKRS